MKDILLKILATLAGIAIGFIPTWLYIIAHNVANPEGFWQKLVLGGVFLYFGAGLQLILLLVVIIWTVIVWKD